MTTAQLVIACLTILALAFMAAWVRWHIRRTELEQAAHRDRLDAADRIRRAEESKAQRAERCVSPATGATLAVHFDGRVVQGTLDQADAATFVLAAASAVSGTQIQPLGGKQYIPRSLVTQIQEL